MRAGIGFDAHRYSDDASPLVLGGVAIDHPLGLAGHSDGDVAAHAVVDAVLGAAGLGDIGTHFSSSDERWRDAPGQVFLERSAQLAREAGYAVVNVDVTVICEVPRLESYRDKMAASIAGGLGVATAAVNVKATSTDGMGFTGRAEGVAAIAVALLESLAEDR